MMHFLEKEIIHYLFILQQKFLANVIVLYSAQQKITNLPNAHYIMPKIYMSLCSLLQP
jgi:hypothetical protein